MARTISFDFKVNENGSQDGIQVDNDITVDIFKQDGTTLIQQLSLVSTPPIVFNATTKVYEVIDYDLDNDPPVDPGLTNDDELVVVSWTANKDTVPVDPQPYTEQVRISTLAAGGASCEAFGWVKDIAEQPIQNARVVFELDGVAQQVDQASNSYGISANTIEVLTDANGFFKQKLIRGSIVRIFIPSLGFNKGLTIPDQASVNVFEATVPVP